MYVKYAASTEKVNDEEAMWVGDDAGVFENVSDSSHFNKEIYFYPSNPPEPVWLWVLGHEKACKNKIVIDRLWRTRWVFHVCVGGKGYYNGQPLKRGDCFLTWPYIKHSIVADPDDPFEFYWLIIRGEETMKFVHDHGFRNTQAVFEIGAIERLEELFKLGMNTDFKNVDIYEYTMSLVRMIFSYYKNSEDDEVIDSQIQAGDYVSMAKQLLRDSNYSLYITDISAKIGITPKHLNKVFYRETGENLKQYITRKRFSAVEKFLKKGMPVTDIARVVGYSTYDAFYRAFITRYSMTPSEYVEKALRSKDK